MHNYDSETDDGVTVYHADGTITFTPDADDPNAPAWAHDAAAVAALPEPPAEDDIAEMAAEGTAELEALLALRAARSAEILTQIAADAVARPDPDVSDLFGGPRSAPQSTPGHRDAVAAPTTFHDRLAAATFTRDDLANLPTPEPLIDGVLDRRTVALLAGTYGTCKSFLALDWAASLATGCPWQGRTAHPINVLYVAGEGAYGLERRLLSWERARKVRIPRDALTVVGLAVQLSMSYERDVLADMAREGGYGLVVIDTLARSAVGKDENSAKDMGELVAGLDKIKDAMTDVGGAVLAVHHTGKDKATVRGSSALEGAMDVAWLSTGEPAALRLVNLKAKDRAKVAPLPLRLVDIDGPETGVIEGPSLASTDDDARGATDEAFQVLFRAFSQHPFFTKADAVAVLKDAEVGRSQAYAHLNALAKAHRIAADDKGTRWTFVLADGDAPPF